MFLRSHFFQLLKDANRFSYRQCVTYSNTICKTSRLWTDNGANTSLLRCYSNNTKNREAYEALKSPTENTEKDEDEIEVLDLEKERGESLKQSNIVGYKVFKDEDSPIILDVEEERLLSQLTDSVSKEADEYEGINLERGVNGVFDIEELVSILKDKNTSNITVIEIPPELGYADHMIIVTAKSTRHMLSTATYVRKLFKLKRHKNDEIPIIEGKRSKNDGWFALDLGNIILHLFSKSTRKEYDLETLWSVGPDFDSHLHQSEDPLSAIISKHSSYLGDLKPVDKDS